MTRPRKIDPAEAALISQHIRETLGFLEEIIDDPTRIDHLPTGSTLDFRVIWVRDERIRLTAYRPSGSDEPWSARVTFHEPLSERLAVTSPGRAPAMWDAVTTGETADEAFDALEAALRAEAADHLPLPARQRR